MFIPYFYFDKNANEAIAFYQKAFDAKVIEKRQYKEMPPSSELSLSETDKELMMHAQLEIHGNTVMLSDSLNHYQAGTNIKLTLIVDEATAKKTWERLKEDATITFDLQPTFFAKLHGELTDKFGISWVLTVASTKMTNNN